MKPKQQRRTEAAERDTAWQKMNPAQQLAALDGRLGKGVGAVKQRARLQAKINKVLDLGIKYGAGPATLEKINVAQSK